MFGENLPDRFWDSLKPDFGAADLLLVMGTSLVVQPFAGLIDRVGPRVPRLLLNRERVGEADEGLRGLGWTRGFEFPPRVAAWRDVLELGDADAGVWHLAALLGWEDDLRELVRRADRDAVSPAQGSADSGPRPLTHEAPATEPATTAAAPGAQAPPTVEPPAEAGPAPRPDSDGPADGRR